MKRTHRDRKNLVDIRENEETRLLAEEITELQGEMAATLEHFSATADPELLEYYTYYYKASEVKHSYLLKKLKKLYYKGQDSRHAL